LGLTAANNKYPRAFLSKTFGNAEANAGAAAGDDSYFAGEFTGHRDLLVD